MNFIFIILQDGHPYELLIPCSCRGINPEYSSAPILLACLSCRIRVMSLKHNRYNGTTKPQGISLVVPRYHVIHEVLF